jgi:hypothetical protein
MSATASAGAVAGIFVTGARGACPARTAAVSPDGGFLWSAVCTTRCAASSCRDSRQGRAPVSVTR